MQDRLRVVFVEADHGTAAQRLTDCRLDFSRKCLASPRELRAAATDFNPHIVLCTDDMSATSSHGLLEALRVLCSQTPAILVLSVCDAACASECKTAAGPLEDIRWATDEVRSRPATEMRAPRVAQDAWHLRKGFSSVLEATAAPAVIANADGWITFANASACRLLKGSYERSLVTILSGTVDQCSSMPHWLPISHDVDRESDQSSGIFSMTGPEIVSQENCRRLAYLDAWSLLPTLVHMDDLIGCATGCERQYRAALALIAADLDSGRIPDESCGRASDNELVDGGASDSPMAVARHGTILRLGPDDFLALLPDPARPGDAAITIHRLLDSILWNQDAALDQWSAATKVTAPANATDLRDGHLSRSNAPMQGSRSPSRRVAPSRAPGTVRSAEHEPLGAELGDAMQRQALSVQYQPQFELGTGRGCGVEALARWVLSSGSAIAPSVFIPLAEREGMIQALGAWMLESACETAYSWCSRDAQRTTLSVNVSALQIDEEFFAVISRTLETSGFPAKKLELEITESALIANPELTIEYLKQWKELGVRIAMDDFGTGYSSLSYLSRLPVDSLKLDQSLIHRITLDKKSAAITRSIVALGAEIGIDVIAEGVETEEQLQMLIDLDCPRAQGYLLGRPMPAKQAQVALRKTWGDRGGPVSRPLRTTVGESHVH
jgi:EAL domain-containing protein (putative c-di-GMP-specific phosphodiesterase class I)